MANETQIYKKYGGKKVKRILLAAFRLPFPLTSGDKIRFYHIGKLLSKRYQVDLLTINEGRVKNEYPKEVKDVFSNIINFSFSRIKFLNNVLMGILSKDPLQVNYFYFGEVQHWFEDHYKEYDLVFCFHVRMAKYFREITNKPKVIDFIDATSINYTEAEKRAKGLWKIIYPIENHRLLSYELKTLEEFDKSFISSPFDKAYLEKNIGHTNDDLVVIPNGVKEELFHRDNRFGGGKEEWLVFLGRMNYAPNEDAAIFFAKRVFPLIRKKANVKFLDVGTTPTKEVLQLRKLDGVEVTGFVEDSYEYLERAKVIVAPLRFSAGSQYKILESMALGKVVVTTSKGARGIEGKDGKHFIIADRENEMAAKVLDLLAEEHRRRYIGENAKQLIKEKYSWSVVGEKLFKEIEELLD